MKRRYLVFLIPFIILLAGCNPTADFPPSPTSIPLDIEGSNSSASLVSPERSLYLPEGFKINVFVEGLQEPKMMAFGPDQKLFITEFGTGRVLGFSDEDGNGVADGIEVAAEGLIEPSGIAFYKDESLFVAETTRVFRLNDPDGDGFYQDRETILSGIPAGGFTNRTLIFSPDWDRLYLAVGASCNVCEEIDQRRGSILIVYIDSGDAEVYASGIRSAVGLTFRPNDESIWTAVINRDGMSKGNPPDSIYRVTWYVDAGWPECHAGKIIDPDFGDKDSCVDLRLPTINLPAGSAPYGIEFYSGSQFPAEYQGDLFIALHGSGEGSAAKGYKIIRRPYTEEGPGDLVDFAVGWLMEDGTHWGTPMDLVEGPDGSLFLSDDYAGVIYRIVYEGN